MKISEKFYQTGKLSTFDFSPVFCYTSFVEGYRMDHESFETKLIRKQNLYIRQLEEQLKVYQEKDRAQELLIEKLNRALELLAEELSETRSLDKEDTRKGE